MLSSVMQGRIYLDPDWLLDLPPRRVKRGDLCKSTEAAAISSFGMHNLVLFVSEMKIGEQSC